MSRTLLGMEMAYGSVRLVEARKTPAGFVVSQWIDLPMPAEAYREGLILEPRTVGMAIRAALKTQFRPGTRKAAVSVTGNAVLARRVTLPRLKAHRLRALLETQGDQWIPFIREGAAFDFAVTNASVGENEQEVLLTAVPMRHVDMVSSALKVAGLTLAALDIDTVALYRAALSRASGQAGDAVAVLHVDQTRGRLSVMEKDQLLAVRSLDAPLSNTEDFLAEVRRSVEAILFRRREELKLTGLLLVSSAPGAAELAEAVKRELQTGLGQQVADALQVIQPGNSGAPPAAEVGLGMALIKAGTPKGMDLLPRPTVSERKQTQLSLALSVAAVAGIAFYGNGWSQELPHLETRHAQLQATLTKLQTELAREPQVAANEARITGYGPLVTHINRNDPWSQALPDLKSLMPSGIILTSIAGEPPSLTLAGTAPTPDLVGLFIQALEDSPRFMDPVLQFSEAGTGPVSFGIAVEMARREVIRP